MKRRRGLLGVFLFFLFIAFLLFFAFRIPVMNSLTGFFQVTTLPLQRMVHVSFWNFTLKHQNDQQLLDENVKLRRQLIEMAEIKKENDALHDQFETTELSIYEQIPATIVGSKGFIPGVSLPSQITLDKGEIDKIQVGNAVVSKNNLIGIVVRVTPHLSLVDLITKQGVTLTGKELSTGALGVIRGKGDGVVLDNVVLSDKLNQGEVVISKGDLNENGIGIPPNIVIGKITSIDRRPSNLFQSAEVQSLVNIHQLSTVFIVKVK